MTYQEAINILQVKGSDQEDIKVAYREAVKRWHPDINPVEAGGGNAWNWKGRWYVAHLACSKTRKSEVIEVRTSGGTFYRNAKGRCEDAPCCGCCTI